MLGGVRRLSQVTDNPALCSFENAEQRLSKKEAEDAEQKQIDEQEKRVEDAKKKAEEVAQENHMGADSCRNGSCSTDQISKRFCLGCPSERYHLSASC